MSEPNPIDAILARLKASTAPAVNPSVAAQVLDTATRAEVANAPATATPFLQQLEANVVNAISAPAPTPAVGGPAPVPIAPDAPDPRPAPAPEPKTRRTAAVVQQELDAALIRIAELEARAPLQGDCLDTTEKLVAALRARGYRVGLSAE